MKLNNGVNSTIFLFSRFHQISVDVVLCQNTQNSITFMVRCEIFSHLTMKGCRDLERGSGSELHPQIRRERCFTLFLGQFRRSWASILAQKNGVQNSILLISAKVLTKLNGSGRIFLALNFLACSIWLISQISLIRKLLMFRFELCFRVLS